MKQTIFTESPDITWLFNTHIPSYACTETHTQCEVALIYGNEDSPEKVELFSVNDYKAKPYATFLQNDSGNLVMEKDI